MLIWDISIISGFLKRGADDCSVFEKLAIPTNSFWAKKKKKMFWR